LHSLSAQLYSAARSTSNTACRCDPGYTGENGTLCSKCSNGMYKAGSGPAPCITCPSYSVDAHGNCDSMPCSPGQFFHCVEPTVLEGLGRWTGYHCVVFGMVGWLGRCAENGLCDVCGCTYNKDTSCPARRTPMVCSTCPHGHRGDGLTCTPCPPGTISTVPVSGECVTAPACLPSMNTLICGGWGCDCTKVHVHAQTQTCGGGKELCIH